jgi:translocation and assembly module TamB
LSGDSDTPRISGEILLLSPATIRARGMVREMTLDAAKISLRPGSVRIDELRGQMSGGKFAASGDLGLDGFKPDRWNLRFDGTNLPYRSAEILIEADANLRATGSGVVPRVSGNIEIIRGRYLRKFRLEQFVFVQRGVVEEEEDEEDVEADAYLQELELDIHARSAGAIKLKIDAQAFATEMDLGADVFIRGTAANPLLDGRVMSESGWLKFPSAKLDVEQLVVDFKPTLQESIHPLIDLVATGEVTAAPSGGESRPTPYQVSVHIDGPLNAMRLDLTSDPSLPQDEVLSLVVLGQADPTMLVEASPTKGSGRIESSLVFAGSQLATPVTRFLEKQLEKQLNLDLQLGTEVSSERFRLTAAKELTSRFRIEGGYERLFTESAELMTGRALLFLSNDLFLEGSAQNVTAFNTTSDLETGTSGALELKLRLLGE